MWKGFSRLSTISGCVKHYCIFTKKPELDSDLPTQWEIFGQFLLHFGHLTGHPIILPSNNHSSYFKIQRYNANIHHGLARTLCNPVCASSLLIRLPAATIDLPRVHTFGRTWTVQSDAKHSWQQIKAAFLTAQVSWLDKNTLFMPFLFWLNNCNNCCWKSWTDRTKLQNWKKKEKQWYLFEKNSYLLH